MRRFGLTLLATAITAAFLLISPTIAAEAKSFDIPLWEKGAPGANGKEPKDIPLAMVRLPASNSPTGALVICPGGGYGGLAMGHEGNEMAEWPNACRRWLEAKQFVTVPAK